MIPLLIPLAMAAALIWAAPQLAYDARNCRAVCAIEMLER